MTPEKISIQYGHGNEPIKCGLEERACGNCGYYIRKGRYKNHQAECLREVD